MRVVLILCLYVSLKLLSLLLHLDFQRQVFILKTQQLALFDRAISLQLARGLAVIFRLLFVCAFLVKILLLNLVGLPLKLSLLIEEFSFGRHELDVELLQHLFLFFDALSIHLLPGFFLYSIL